MCAQNHLTGPSPSPVPLLTKPGASQSLCGSLTAPVRKAVHVLGRPYQEIIQQVLTYTLLEMLLKDVIPTATETPRTESGRLVHRLTETLCVYKTTYLWS